MEAYMTVMAELLALVLILVAVLLLPLDELLVLVPQQLIPLVLVLPTGGVLLLLALPFIDRGPERNPFERPAVMVPGGFAVLFVVILTLLGSGRLFNL